MCCKGHFQCLFDVGSPSARGLTESKLQSIEDAVSVTVSRGGARSDVVSLLPSLSPAGEIHGTAWLADRRSLLCQSGVVPRPVVSTR